MPKKSQIIQCQCGTIYITKNLNFQRGFRCPECGQSPGRDSLRTSWSSPLKKQSNQHSFKFSLLSIANLFAITAIGRYGYFRFKNLRVLDTQLYVHWLVLTASVLISIVYWQSPLDILIALLSYFTVIFIHEAGHAAMATKLGCRVWSIRIGLLHGVCEYEEPKYELDDVKIAWSGVLLQILVAALVFSLSSFGLKNYSFFAPILLFMGYFSLLIVPYNLIPLNGLDGRKAWRIIPILYKLKG